jgi:hypothetical protein
MPLVRSVSGTVPDIYPCASGKGNHGTAINPVIIPSAGRRSPEYRTSIYIPGNTIRARSHKEGIIEEAPAIPILGEEDVGTANKADINVVKESAWVLIVDNT